MTSTLKKNTTPKKASPLLQPYSASARCYKAQDGSLVAAGDTKAKTLFCGEGQRKRLGDLKDVPGMETFFPEAAQALTQMQTQQDQDGKDPEKSIDPTKDPEKSIDPTKDPAGVPE